MNAFPQRPKFYLHRSRRFWGGLVVLMLLFVWWHLSRGMNIKFKLGRFESSSLAYSERSDQAILGLDSGSLVFRYFHFDIGNLGVKRHAYWDLEIDQSGRGYARISRWWPTGWLDIDAGIFHTGLSLPIWIILILWSILWPLWIRRGDKLEEKRFKGLV